MDQRREDLPTRWNTTTVDDGRDKWVQYGIFVDFHRHSYSLYVSDLEKVWIDRANTDQLIASAKQNGMEDLDNTKLTQLLTLINDSIYDSTSVTISGDGDNLSMNLTAKQLSWRFRLQLQSDNGCVWFLSKLTKQLFVINDFLYYEKANLNTVINSKDIYSKFLAENFKLSHGVDLISTFKKNNKTSADDFAPFNHTKWVKKIESSYKHSHRQFKAMVDSCFHDHIAWKFANQKPPAKPDVATPSCSHLHHSKFETITDTSHDSELAPKAPPMASEPTKMEPEVPFVSPESTTALKSTSPPLKVEPNNELVSSRSTESESKKTSPRKRMASFGTFASRKKRRSTQTS